MKLRRTKLMINSKHCDHCCAKADVVEQDSFYLCAKCWLVANKDKAEKAEKIKKERNNG